MYKRHCNYCGKYYEGLGKYFCSRFCSSSYHSETMNGENNPNWRGQTIDIICDNCGKKFRRGQYGLNKFNKNNFCSPKCKAEWQKKHLIDENNPNYRGGPIKVKCQNCGIEFKVIPYRGKVAKYCSEKCMGQAMKGQISPNKGKKFPERGGKNHYNWKGGPVEKICQYCGKKFLTKLCYKDKAKYCSRKCRSLSPQYREQFKGENNPAWLNGISKEPYTFEFNDELKEKIRKRDNYTCQLCGKIQEEEIARDTLKRRLSIHHMDYNKKNSNENNLITLCRKCNVIVNFNRDDWTKYFQNKLNNLNNN